MRYLSILITLFLLPQTVFSLEGRQRTISVAGNAEVRVAPDQVIIAMAVINKEKSLEAAKSANDKTVKSLIFHFTDKLNIDPKHVQTDYLSVNAVYNSCSHQEEQKGLCDPLKIQFHNVEKGIQLRLNDLSKYESVIAKSFEIGVNKISNIQFVTTELRKHKDKAREMAAVAAKEKALAVAKTLGMSVGNPITINVNDINWAYRGRGGRLGMQNSMMNMGGGGMGEDGSSLAAGQINITASVNVTFGME